MSNLSILPMQDVHTSYYLRLVVADETGVLAKITGILAQTDISIDAVLQRPTAESKQETDLIILTHTCLEAHMNAAMTQIQALKSVLAPIVRIRKEDLS
jgi:homoserine dehydrogenase